MKTTSAAAVFALSAAGLALSAATAQAQSWSDTYIGYRYGTAFTEPTNRNDITKNVIQFTHASGYSLGQNFFNLDILKSDSKDPANGGSSGATEFYATYRHLLSFGKVLDKALSFGPVKDVGFTAGFDLNSKNTAFAPQKRLLVAGPTLRFDVPGYLDVSVLAAREWNHCGLGAPACPRSDIVFDPQLMLSAAWGIPFQAGPLPLKFQGFINYLTAKGRDYANVETKPETLMRTSLMVDVGQLTGGKKNTFLMGVGYELWRNKFGNHAYANGVTKPGIDTNAPTFQAEWHF